MKMNKEEILAKSRTENKEQDLFEKEFQMNAVYIGTSVAAILASIFVVIQMLVGKGMNYGLYAVMFSIPATGYIIRVKRFKKSRDIAFMVCYLFASLMFSIAHILELLKTSTIA